MFLPSPIFPEIPDQTGPEERRTTTRGRSGQEIIGLLASGIAAFSEGNEQLCDSDIASALALLNQTLEQNNSHLRLGAEIERIRNLMTAIAPFTSETTAIKIGAMLENLNQVCTSEINTERPFLDQVYAEIIEIIIKEKSPEQLHVLSSILKGTKQLSPFSRLIQSEKITALASALQKTPSLTAHDTESADERWKNIIDICEALLDLLRLKHHPSQIHLVNVCKMTRIFRAYWQKEGHQDCFGVIGNEIEVAALYHDLGKLAVSNSILDSDQPLTPEQRIVMKSHVEKSASLIRILLGKSGAAGKGARMIRAVANHHQYYDGGGYPDQGLKGRAIGFEAQVISALDMLEAMTSDGRSYRQESDFSHTLDKITNDQPRKIAPEICALLFDMRAKGYWDGFFGVQAENQESDKVSANPIGLSPQTRKALAEWFEDRSHHS